MGSHADADSGRDDARAARARPWRLGPRQRVLCWIVQRIFRINHNCPWPVHFTSLVQEPHKITIGRGVEKPLAVSGHCLLMGTNGIEIGDDTIFGPGVGILSANHDPDDLSKFLPAPPIRIGRGCWIGMNAVILPGVALGDHVVVGAGAVVTHSFPPNVIIAGVPAQIIRHLNEKPV